MSSGHRDLGDPAAASQVIRMLQMNPGLRAHVGRPPNVDRSFRVPYLAGSSRDGQTVYIDAQTPACLKCGIEPDEFYAMHECFEWYCMAMLGLPYNPAAGLGAHRRALGFEHMMMRMQGIEDEQIAAYEEESDELAESDEHAGLPPEAFPPDLYLGPYEDDPDELDERLLPLLRQARMLAPPVTRIISNPRLPAREMDDSGAVSQAPARGPIHSVRRPW